MSTLAAMLMSATWKPGIPLPGPSLALGTPVIMAASQGASNPLVSTDPVTTTAGQGLLLFVTARQNGNPGATFGEATITPDVGDPVVLTQEELVYLGGAGRQLGAFYWGRNLIAAEWDLSIAMGSTSHRDFVAFAVPVTGMKATDSPFTGVDSTTVNTSASSITLPVTAAQAGDILIGFVAFGIGSDALDFTGVGGTRVVQAASGAGGTNVDIAACLVTATAANTTPVDLGATAAVADDDRLCIVLAALNE